jgi:ribosomal protein S26
MRRNLGKQKLDDDAGGLRDTVQCSAAPKAVKPRERATRRKVTKISSKSSRSRKLQTNTTIHPLYPIETPPRWVRDVA